MKIRISIFILISFLSTFGQSQAETISILSDRILPQGKLIYSDERQSYYVVTTNVRWEKKQPNPSPEEIRQAAKFGVNIDTQAYNRIVGFRKPDSQGQLFKYTKIKAKDLDGSPVPAYLYAKSEIDFINKKLAPAIEKFYPGLLSIRINYYFTDQHYTSSSLFVEMPLFVAKFKRMSDSKEFKPSYAFNSKEKQFIYLKGEKGWAERYERSMTFEYPYSLIPELEVMLEGRERLTSAQIEERRKRQRQLAKKSKAETEKAKAEADALALKANAHYIRKCKVNLIEEKRIGKCSVRLNQACTVDWYNTLCKDYVSCGPIKRLGSHYHLCKRKSLYHIRQAGIHYCDPKTGETARSEEALLTKICTN